MFMESTIVEMKPVSLYEVKEILKARKAEKELNYEQDLTMKYVEKFAKLTEKQTKDLLKDLSEIEFLKDNEVLRYEILNVIPTRVEQLQLIIPKTVTATDEELKKVIELTQKLADKVE
jgi:DNA-directed RNA polymerase subunit F